MLSEHTCVIPGTPSMNAVPAPDRRQHHDWYLLRKVVIDPCTLTVLMHSVPMLVGEK